MSKKEVSGSLCFLEHFSDLDDPRQSAKILYPLDEVLLLTLCAILSGADYVLALKGNQGTLRKDVELLFTEQAGKDFADLEVTCHQTVDADHGRIEIRDTVATSNIKCLGRHHVWKGLKTLVSVTSERRLAEKTTRETRYFISSLPPDARAPRRGRSQPLEH